MDTNVFFRLKEERIRLGLNQSDVANAVDMSVKQVGRWETSIAIPSDKLEILAGIGFDAGYVVTGRRTASDGPKFTWHDVEEAGHGMLSDGGVIGAITIDSKQTYEFLLSLLMRNLTKVTGVQAPGEKDSASLNKKTG